MIEDETLFPLLVMFRQNGIATTYKVHVRNERKAIEKAIDLLREDSGANYEKMWGKARIAAKLTM
jgi:hypothetical protein